MKTMSNMSKNVHIELGSASYNITNTEVENGKLVGAAGVIDTYAYTSSKIQIDEPDLHFIMSVSFYKTALVMNVNLVDKDGNNTGRSVELININSESSKSSMVEFYCSICEMLGWEKEDKETVAKFVEHDMKVLARKAIASLKN